MAPLSCLHNAHRGEPGEEHLWGTEETDCFSQVLGGTVLQLSQSKAQETPNTQGSQVVMGVSLGPDLGFEFLRTD